MAKDFDFIPAKRSPRRQTTRATPKTSPMPKKPAPPKRPTKPEASHKSTQAPTPPKRVQTRSSLIDYHPLKVAPKAQQPIPTGPPTSRSITGAATQSVPPYFPPARVLPTEKTKPKKRLNKKTVISAIVSFAGIVLLASGMLIPLLENPSVTIIIYVIAAIIFRLNSRVSFSIALLLLLAIPFLLLIRNSALAGTYAIFCFYFLVVGVISATIELRNTNH